MLSRIVVSLLCLVACVCGCSRQTNHDGRTPLVKVGEMFLYAEDLEEVKPVGLSRDDSVMFTEEYIRNWVEDALLWQNAVRNVEGGHEVKEMVEVYRRSLVLHLFTRWIASTGYIPKYIGWNILWQRDSISKCRWMDMI